MSDTTEMNVFDRLQVVLWAEFEDGDTKAVTKKAVMFALAMFEGRDEGRAYPTYETLETVTRVRRRAIINAVNELERDGFLTRRQDERDDGGSTSNSYWVEYQRVAEISRHVVARRSRTSLKRGGALDARGGALDARGGALDARGGCTGCTPSKEEYPSRGRIQSIRPEEQKTPKPPKGVEGDTEHFQSFYSSYPRKVGKENARKAYAKALSAISARGDPPMGEEAAAAWLAERASAFARSPAGQRGEYTPHPSTWLNAGRFDDDESEWQRDEDRRRSGDTDRNGWTDPRLFPTRRPNIEVTRIGP